MLMIRSSRSLSLKPLLGQTFLESGLPPPRVRMVNLGSSTVPRNGSLAVCTRTTLPSAPRYGSSQETKLIADRRGIDCIPCTSSRRCRDEADQDLLLYRCWNRLHYIRECQDPRREYARTRERWTPRHLVQLQRKLSDLIVGIS